ncbi:uncharacterized protein LOC119964441 isoform X2 [Scyliorhinus canicula]|uniref:uncharacterized protein LOC119964441 isoform X2 n=1 Tax=Scyliorhinus canicula TaxID=7830 RepID=UPI0018F62811|nr:uncharacterized protein LOC119964441 isoform X2 [Scyliorhinus canicula]
MQRGAMRANRQQVIGKIRTRRWDSKSFSYTRWEGNDYASDEGYCQLQPRPPLVHLKCEYLDTETIIISSHLLNTTLGSSEEIATCMNEEQFSSPEGKRSPYQQIAATDLDESANPSQNTTKSLSRGCASAPSIRKHPNWQQSSNIQTATCSSSNKCAKQVLPMPNHGLPGNHLKDRGHVPQSRAEISECGERCNNRPSKCQVYNLAAAKQLFKLERRPFNYLKIERKNKCLDVCSEEKTNQKEEQFQVKGTGCQENAQSRMLNKVKGGVACCTAGKKSEDGSCIRGSTIDKPINSKNIQDSDNSDEGLSVRCLTICPLQPTLDLAREEINTHSYKPGSAKRDHTHDILHGLSKEGMQWKRQHCQLSTISLMEDENPSVEAPKFIALPEQQKPVATAVLLPAFRPHPFKKLLQQNKGTTKFQNQAKCLQENNSIKLYHCTSHTPDEQSVQNIAEMASPENHITISQLLHTTRDGMHQNQDTIQINSLLKENRRTKEINSKQLKEALFLYLQKTKEML